jgi:hypothetical protein
MAPGGSAILVSGEGCFAAEAGRVTGQWGDVPKFDAGLSTIAGTQAPGRCRADGPCGSSDGEPG